jgi:hypothetical protein
MSLIAGVPAVNGQIAFNRNHPTSGEHIFTMNADGGRPQQVTDDSGEELPDWRTHALG